MSEPAGQHPDDRDEMTLAEKRAAQRREEGRAMVRGIRAAIGQMVPDSHDDTEPGGPSWRNLRTGQRERRRLPGENGTKATGLTSSLPRQVGRRGAATPEELGALKKWENRHGS